jgi:hypothetical protein
MKRDVMRRDRWTVDGKLVEIFAGAVSSDHGSPITDHAFGAKAC